MSFQISLEVLLAPLVEKAARLEIKIEELTQKRIRAFETGNTTSIVPLQLAQRELAKIQPQIEQLKAEIEFRAQRDDLPQITPQITPQNNTLRNAFIIGGILLLVL